MKYRRQKTEDRRQIGGYIIGLIIIGLLVIAQNLEAQQHSWYNGHVKVISKGTMTIEDKTYTVDLKVKVVQHTSKKGILSETPVKLTEVKVGDRVSVKLIGDVIKEIIIERY